MKRIQWAAVAALCLIVAGCGSDDDNNSGGGTPKPTATKRPTNTPRAATPTQVAGATRTPTFTPVSGPTNTPGTSANRATVQKFVSGVLSSIAGLSDFAGVSTSSRLASDRAALQIPPIAIPCTGGGTISTGCAASGSGSTLTFTFDGCRNGSGNAQTFIDGTFDIDSPSGCPGVPLPVGQPFSVVVDAHIEAGAGRNKVAGDFDVAETVTLNADGSSIVEASGTVTTDCAGTVSFETVEPLQFPASGDCGTGGQLRVTAGGETALVTLTSGGGVALDYNNDGTADDSFASCTAAALARCN
ncbi:MAG: hypothetical protein SF182_02305 [Deltaproteobacteria bacterium]|nr:hypothetical protein [Deltaproteobacteria bacterium]